jgi:hypothetical protein
MEEEDPRYALFSAKRFIEIDVSRMSEVNGKSEWMDPRGLEECTGPSEKPRVAMAPREVSRAPQVTSSEERALEVEAPRVPLNTSFTQGALLLDPKATTVKKPVDRWSVGTPEVISTPAGADSVPIVEAGAKIKFKRVDDGGVKGEEGPTLEGTPHARKGIET